MTGHELVAVGMAGLWLFLVGWAIGCSMGRKAGELSVRILSERDKNLFNK